MDFSNRSTQPQSAAPGVGSAATTSGAGRKTNKADRSKWTRVASVVLAAAVVVLLVALVAFLAFGSNSDNENKLVDKGKLQAVFLNTGQVYFGNVNVKNSTSKYIVLDNIYYLQTSSTGTGTSTTAANTSVSLVKLGCELHAPYDQMVINRTQVTFWENLQDNGQVAKAVKTFQQQNPQGQKCSDQSAAPTSTTNNVQGSTNSTTTTKP